MHQLLGIDFNSIRLEFPQNNSHILVTDGYHYRSGIWKYTLVGAIIEYDEDDDAKYRYWIPLDY